MKKFKIINFSYSLFFVFCILTTCNTSVTDTKDKAEKPKTDNLIMASSTPQSENQAKDNVTSPVNNSEIKTNIVQYIDTEKYKQLGVRVMMYVGLMSPEYLLQEKEVEELNTLLNQTEKTTSKFEIYKRSKSGSITAFYSEHIIVSHDIQRDTPAQNPDGTIRPPYVLPYPPLFVVSLDAIQFKNIKNDPDTGLPEFLLLDKEGRVRDFLLARLEENDSTFSGITEENRKQRQKREKSGIRISLKNYGYGTEYYLDAEKINKLGTLIKKAEKYTEKKEIDIRVKKINSINKEGYETVYDGIFVENLDDTSGIPSFYAYDGAIYLKEEFEKPEPLNILIDIGQEIEDFLIDTIKDISEMDQQRYEGIQQHRPNHKYK